MADTFLFDTNAISDAMAEHPHFIANMQSHVRVFATSVIVRGEVLYGLRRLPAGKRRDDLTVKALRLLAALACQPITEAVADAYAEVRPVLESRGTMVNDNDLWIAASARAAGCVLVTRDEDFRHVPQLRVVDWTQPAQPE